MKRDSKNPEDQLVTALCAFLPKNIDRLAGAFAWEIPPWKGFSAGDYSSNAEANIELKYFLRNRWRRSDEDNRIKIGKWIVRDWGGINWEDEPIEHLVRAVIADPDCSSMDRISSRSKILAIVDPDKYAIFDSRVAASLNALQVVRSFKHRLWFPIPQGRNTVISGPPNAKMTQSNRGFVQIWNAQTRQKERWEHIRRFAYARYLHVMLECKRQLVRYRLCELEMALFSAAVDLCSSAIAISNK